VRLHSRFFFCCCWLFTSLSSDAAPVIELERVASGFSSPIDIQHATDESDRLFVIEQDFGPGRGLWLHDGAGWRQLTYWSSEQLESIDLF
jgi:hypothetical protein